jgi:hypothetical protein
MADKPARTDKPAGFVEALPPELAAGLAELPAAQQAALGAAAARFAALSPGEQAGVRAAAEREMLDHQAAQVVEGVQDALRRGRTAALLPRLAEAAASCRQTRAPGPPFAELAGFIDAVAALLQGAPAPDVPAAYRAFYATVLSAVTHPERDAQPAADLRNRPDPGPAEGQAPQDG